MGKKRCFLLSALLLLSSCAAPAATVETPLPSISAAVSPTVAHPTLPPEPSATPITVDLDTPLAEVVGKDIDLWRGDLGVDFLDEYPGVREYTSFDDAGDYPVRNLTHYSRRYQDGYCYESFLCTNENYMDGGYNTVLITDAGAGDSFRQVLRADATITPELRDASLALGDLNGDGYIDVKLFCSAYKGGYQTYTALLWGPESDCYYAEPSFVDITEPVFDETRGIWWGGCSYSQWGVVDAAQYLDGRFVVTHTLDIHFDAGESYTITERALERGELRKVVEVTLPFDDREATPPELLTDYATGQASWTGWAGCDFRTYYPGW